MHLRVKIGSLNALILGIGDSRRDYRFVIRSVRDRFLDFVSFNFVPIEFKIRVEWIEMFER